MVVLVGIVGTASLDAHQAFAVGWQRADSLVQRRHRNSRSCDDDLHDLPPVLCRARTTATESAEQATAYDHHSREPGNCKAEPQHRVMGVI